MFSYQLRARMDSFFIRFYLSSCTIGCGHARQAIAIRISTQYMCSAYILAANACILRAMSRVMLSSFLLFLSPFWYRINKLQNWNVNTVDYVPLIFLTLNGILIIVLSKNKHVKLIYWHSLEQLNVQAHTTNAHATILLSKNCSRVEFCGIGYLFVWQTYRYYIIEQTNGMGWEEISFTKFKR